MSVSAQRIRKGGEYMDNKAEEKKSLKNSIRQVFTVVSRLEDSIFGPTPDKSVETATPINSKIDEAVKDLLNIRKRLDRISDALSILE